MTNILSKMVSIKGEPHKVMEMIIEQNIFADSEIGKEGLEDMKLLF